MTGSAPDAHLHPSDRIAQRLGVTPEAGLSVEQVRERQQRHGPNKLPEPPPRRWWQRLAGQFRDFMIWVLLAAALLSGLIGDAVDTVVILVIVVLNALIGW